METTTLSTSRQFAVPSAPLALRPAARGLDAGLPGAVPPFALAVRALGDASALSLDAVRATLHTYRLALATTRDVTTALVGSMLPGPASPPVAPRVIEPIEIVLAPTVVTASTSSAAGAAGAAGLGVLAAIEGEFVPARTDEAPSLGAPRPSRRKRR
ncbi:hypothetical protein [Labilithrix luteola]|nr:hypothetical protein [Labilithrix luteola]